MRGLQFGPLQNSRLVASFRRFWDFDDDNATNDIEIEKLFASENLDSDLDETNPKDIFGKNRF